MEVVDRRGPAVVALGAALLLTVAAVVVAGGRPALQPGVAPALLQGAGYLCALAGGVLLLAPLDGGPGRRSGAVVLAAVTVLVALEVVSADGPDVGGGLLRLLCLAVVAVVTVRLGRDVTVARRR